MSTIKFGEENLMRVGMTWALCSVRRSSLLPVAWLIIAGCGGTSPENDGSDAPSSQPLPAQVTRIDLDAPARVISLSPDGTSLWIWSEDNVLRSVSTEDMSELLHMENVGRLRAVGATPDGEPVAATSELNSSFSGESVLIQAVPTGEMLATLRNAEEVALSPDGEHVIIDIGPSRFARRRITKLSDKLEFRAGVPTQLPHTSLFVLRPDGTTMLVADERGFVQVVDWMTGTAVHARQMMVMNPWSYAVNRGATMVAVGTTPLLLGGERVDFNGIRVWNAETFEEVQVWTAERRFAALTFLDDTRLVSADGDANVQLWTIGESEPRDLYIHQIPITSLLSVPGQDQVILLDQNGALYRLSIP
jgi:WD40 repeat protein